VEVAAESRAQFDTSGRTEAAVYAVRHPPGDDHR
jgi:hypothetical protein